jgi:hypothetical protein
MVGRTVKALRAACLGGIAGWLAGCAGPPPDALTSQGLPEPKTLNYEKQILDWAAGFFAEPTSLRGAEITAPVPYVFGQARGWLVCVGYDARARGGEYLGYRRLAFGFNSGTIYPPLARGNNSVRNDICDTLPLSWRPFPALERLGRTERR